MSKYILGIDIGGTKIQTGIVNQHHKIILEKQFPINRRNKLTAINSILKSIDATLNPEVKQIGIGITGLVDTYSGIVIQSPNLPRDWRRVNLKKIIASKYNRKVAIDNDANCIALAEAVFGLGKKYNHILSITIGTGIGAGLINHKKIYRGSQNSLEFGHTIISNESPNCSCGKIGHFEALVSGQAMVKLYHQETGHHLSTYEIIKKMRAGNKKAKKIIGGMSKNLAIGIANAIHSYNPEIIIIGGGLSVIPEIINPALKSYKKILIYPELSKTKVVKSNLNYQAGILGAALLTRYNKY